MNFLTRFLKKIYSNIKFHENRVVRPEFCNADRQANIQCEGHEADSRFLQKWKQTRKCYIYKIKKKILLHTQFIYVDTSPTPSVCFAPCSQLHVTLIWKSEILEKTGGSFTAKTNNFCTNRIWWFRLEPWQNVNVFQLEKKKIINKQILNYYFYTCTVHF